MFTTSASMKMNIRMITMTTTIPSGTIGNSSTTSMAEIAIMIWMISSMSSIMARDGEEVTETDGADT